MKKEQKRQGQPFRLPPLAVLALLLCVLPALLASFSFLLPAQYEDTFLGELRYKLERLSSVPGKRIIVIGGSSVPFSLKSGLVEAYLPDYQVVDLGMYADLGTVALLDLAKSEVHEGDLFVLAPEQNAQTLSCHFSGEDAWQAADGAFWLLARLDRSRYGRLAAALPAFAGKKLYYTLFGAPVTDDIYSRASFDAYGDIACPGRERNLLPAGYDPNTPISFSTDLLSQEFLDELNRFAREVTALGASVVYHFSPMNAAALSPGTSRADVDAYYDALNAALIFPIIGNPNRCLLDADWFFDSNFHLNDSGAIVFTKLLIEDLKLYFKDTSPTELALPERPKRADADPDLLQTGDDSCAALFTYVYSEAAGGWLLEGLTAQGQTATELILPVSYRGEPVVGLSEGLFSGNTVVQSITIQPNIRLLYDGMFAGCTALRSLILTGETPSDHTVGSGLREGADFLIYVPAAAIDSYRRSYFWQTYDAWLHSR